MFLKILQNPQKKILAGVSLLAKSLAGNLKLAEAATGDSLQNKVFLKILQISQEKTCVETQAQVHSCEFCKLFKNTYFLEDLQTASPETPVRGSFFDKVGSRWPEGF